MAKRQASRVSKGQKASKAAKPAGKRAKAPAAKPLALQRDLAAACGVSEKTVSLWLRREDWPVKPVAPWSAADLEQIQAWRAGLQEDRRTAAELLEAEDPRDRLLHDAEHAEAGARLARSMGDVPAAKRLEEKAATLRREAEALAANPGTPQGGRPKQPKRSIDWLLKRERRLKIKQEREIQAGLYVRREVLERAMLAITELYVGSLSELEQALPPLVAGRDPGQVERILRDRFGAARTRLAEKRTLELQRAEEAIKTEAKSKARGRGKAKR